MTPGSLTPSDTDAIGRFIDRMASTSNPHADGFTIGVEACAILVERVGADCTNTILAAGLKHFAAELRAKVKFPDAVLA